MRRSSAVARSRCGTNIFILCPIFSVPFPGIIEQGRGGAPVCRESFLLDGSRPFLFRSGRGSEFLKARIIPERIEQWIEPEQRSSERAGLRQRASAGYGG